MIGANKDSAGEELHPGNGIIPWRWQIVFLVVLLRFGARYCVDVLNLLQKQVVERMSITYT
jgi:hypothetical protein